MDNNFGGNSGNMGNNENTTGNVPNNMYNADANQPGTVQGNSQINTAPAGNTVNNNQFNGAPANPGFNSAPNNSQNFNNSNMSWGQEAGSSSGYAPQPSMNNAQQYNQYNATPHVTPNSGGMGFGYASLVLGILSIITLCCCCGPIPGILAVVFGIIQIGRTPEKKGICIAGIVTGAIGILLSIIMYISFMTGVDYDNPAKDFYDDIYWNIQEELDKTNTDL